MMPSTTRPEWKKGAYRLLAVAFWLLAWQLTAMAVGHEFLLASPLQVFISFVRLLTLPSSYLAFLNSTLRVLVGFFTALCLALLLAAGASRSRLIHELVSPLVALARSVPVTSFVILAIILVSTRWLSALIAFVIAFPVIYSNVLEGLFAQDKALLEVAAVFRVTPFRKLIYITLPQLYSYLLSGAVTALGLSWKSGIAAEVIGIPRGSIGEKLYSAKVNYNTADLLAWTAFIVLLSLLTNKILKALFSRGREALTRL
ncbi:MAG: ABC transporter permease subunit [Bacillota bacterium]|nr:ABC transporter permease subunit [Bacillota bacterium]